jgi:hypothetical protein
MKIVVVHRGFAMRNVGPATIGDSTKATGGE